MESAVNAPNDIGRETGNLGRLRALFGLRDQPRGIGKTLGIRGVEAAPGRVALAGIPTEDHYNPSGSVHGGYAATMLDGALALAVFSVLDEGETYSTLNLNVTYTRAMTQDSGPLRADGRMVHRSKRTALAEGQLFDRQGRLCAHATATFHISPPAS